MLRPWGKLFGFRALHSAGTRGSGLGICSGFGRDSGFGVRASGYKHEQLFGIGPGPALADPAKVNQNQVNSAALRCAFFGKNAQLCVFNVCNHCIFVYDLRHRQGDRPLAIIKRKPNNALYSKRYVFNCRL